MKTKRRTQRRKTTGNADEQRAAKHWNAKHDAGTLVRFSRYRGGPTIDTRTRSGAWVMPSGIAVVLVEQVSGAVALDLCQAAEDLDPAAPRFELFAEHPAFLAAAQPGQEFVTVGTSQLWHARGSDGRTRCGRPIPTDAATTEQRPQPGRTCVQCAEVLR